MRQIPELSTMSDLTSSLDGKDVRDDRVRREPCRIETVRIRKQVVDLFDPRLQVGSTSLLLMNRSQHLPEVHEFVSTEPPDL